jgi:hypothetical protein
MEETMKVPCSGVGFRSAGFSPYRGPERRRLPGKRHTEDRLPLSTIIPAAIVASLVAWIVFVSAAISIAESLPSWM